MALPQTVSTAEVSRLFGVSAKTIAAWTASGVLARVGRGKYNLAKSVRSVVKHHKRSSQQTTVAAAVGSERARLLKLQADKLELAIRIECGDLMRVSEVRHEVQKSFAGIRSGVMAVLPRVAGEVPHLGREGHAVLDDALREALNVLAHNRYAGDTEWTVKVDELAEQLGLTREAVDRLAKSGVLAQPDSEGRVSLWGSVRALVAMKATGKGIAA
jgi:phage terminase Nu1 subunit (DNA packaging protein)